MPTGTIKVIQLSNRFRYYLIFCLDTKLQICWWFIFVKSTEYTQLVYLSQQKATFLHRVFLHDSRIDGSLSSVRSVSVGLKIPPIFICGWHLFMSHVGLCGLSTSIMEIQGNEELRITWIAAVSVFTLINSEIIVVTKWKTVPLENCRELSLLTQLCIILCNFCGVLTLHKPQSHQKSTERKYTINGSK